MSDENARVASGPPRHVQRPGPGGEGRLPFTNSDLIGVPGGASLLTSPALVIDLPAMMRNLRRMQDLCTEAGMNFRPHAKTHKCAEIAREQIALGATGVCCATPHEAVALANVGINQILLTSPVVQQRQVAALCGVHARGVGLTVVVDHPNQVELWNSELSRSPRQLQVLVDVDIGMARTGAASPASVVEVARRVAACPCLGYAGVQAYSGMVQHIAAFTDREAAYFGQLDQLKAVIDVLGEAGMRPGIVSGGGTGSFALDAKRGLLTESQAGSYAFMDVEYNEVELFEGGPAVFETSLFLRTSVISANAAKHVTVNAGFKCLATDGPLPKVLGSEALKGWTYEFYGDEFGRVRFSDDENRPALGSAVNLVTSHCDPTVNLHDVFHVVDNGTLIDIWLIVGRGVL